MHKNIQKKDALIKTVSFPALCLKAILIILIAKVITGCATIEYYEFLEPKRSNNAQFIDMPYVYSGLVTTDRGTSKRNTSEKWYNHQFSGVLHDRKDKLLNINIPSKISVKEHPMISRSLDAKLRKNLVKLSNSNSLLDSGEPALLVINPSHPFNYNEIKTRPNVFFKEHYLRHQPSAIKQTTMCPHILILNIDIYEEQPTTIEFGHCSDDGSHSSSFIWEDISHAQIQNNVQHSKPFGYQLGYLGFLVTLPIDAVVTPLYTLGWGIVASKNLLMPEENY